MNSSAAHPFIKWFADITITDIPLVGGKNASLGEMVRELAGKDVKVPDGFAITAEAFRHFIREAGIDERIRATLADLDTRDMANLSERGQAVRQAILNATLPPYLQGLIGEAYRQLLGGRTVPLDVAVRSSSTAEDLPDASFAGQQETTAALLETCKRCFASLFTDRAISCRMDKGFDHFKVALSICGQAPGAYPEFVQFLVEQGIDSISLNPDTVLKTTLAILETESHADQS